MDRRQSAEQCLFQSYQDKRSDEAEDMINGMRKRRLKKQLDKTLRTVCTVIIVIGVTSSVLFLLKSWGFVYGQ